MTPEPKIYLHNCQSQVIAWKKWMVLEEPKSLRILLCRSESQTPQQKHERMYHSPC
jgi:hypothetical protein